ncbi:ribonuclease M5 [Macrococcus hajekii]|uniref:Ribonuclease M5 n=1 Tax=Macrococcus hajekii TaxID=198482 RepID=A0A4R6BHK0_9STAP|nr:ribonuclease M5 [Macrococcus hajekii]TDM01048.1 ribonuclease M5 [Macrococcus hajekii]GGB12812.1 ribonuclease M5 [Macrococcus hajekii]
MKINEIVIVEGKDDTVRVKQAVDCDTIETNGSAINEATLQTIEHAAEKRGVIILTDPDYPGNKIRTTIEKRVPGAKQAFIDASIARNKRGKIGIEHAPLAAIEEALINVSTPFDSDVETISKQLLVDLGLIIGPGAKERRAKVCSKLKIGYCNGKQLFHRLNAFGVTEEDVKKAIK